MAAVHGTALEVKTIFSVRAKQARRPFKPGTPERGANLDIKPWAAVALVCLIYVLVAFGGLGLERTIGKNVILDTLALIAAIALALRSRVPFFRPAEGGAPPLPAVMVAKFLSLLLVLTLLSDASLLFLGSTSASASSEACISAHVDSTGFVRSVVLAPIYEELLFAGFLFAVLRSRIGASLSILLVASLFSVLHLPSGFDHFLSRLLYMSASCLLVLKFGVIWPSITYHVLNNLALLTMDQAKQLCEYLASGQGGWEGSEYILPAVYGAILCRWARRQAYQRTVAG